MNRLKSVVPILLGVFVLSGCVHRKEVVVVKETPEQPPSQKETLQDTITKDTTSYFKFTPDTTLKNEETPEAAPTESTETNKIHGYRVQIFAFSTRDRAEKAKEEAEQVLSLPVYIEYDPTIDGPYKVRVGDFTSRDEAEKYKEKLREEGYPDAFVVETEINK